MRKRRCLTGILAVVLSVGCLVNMSGCSKKEIAFTTGLAKDEVFKIDGEECTVEQAKVVLLDLQREYESLFGTDSWDRVFGDGTLENYVKEQALKQLSQIYSMSLLAKSEEIQLTDEEMKDVQKAAKEYVSAVKAVNKDVNIETEAVEMVYTNYKLANKYYDSLLATVDSEISDDEARIITVQHILLKTSAVTGNGVEVELTEGAVSALYGKANEIRQKAVAGENFQTLASRYSEDEMIQCTFGRGEMSEAFEETAFNLANEEISEVVESEAGLHIIKCISNYDEAATNENKKKIYEQRCSEVVNNAYNTYISEVLTEFNDEAWEDVKIQREFSVASLPTLF